MGFDQSRANPYYAPQQPRANQARPMSPTPAPAPDPGRGSAYASPPPPAPTTFRQTNPFALLSKAQNKLKEQQNAQPKAPYGSESGPGILENWFNQRATGTDPAFEYASKRGMADLANRSAAAGSFNSGAARQGESDFMANLVSQREGQLDALAGGASGEHAGRLAQMFGTGNALASGESGINSAYDLAAANAQSNAISAALGFGINKAGVDSQSNKQGISNLIGIGSLFA